MIPDRVGADEEAVPAVEGRAELAVAQAGIDQHVVAAAVGDDQVGDAVAVEVGQLDGAGSEQARGLVAQHGRSGRRRTATTTRSSPWSA